MAATTRQTDAQTLKSMINDGDELALIDVREAGQFGVSHLLLAVPVPYSLLEARITTLIPRMATRTVLIDAGDGIARLFQQPPRLHRARKPLGEQARHSVVIRRLAIRPHHRPRRSRMTRDAAHSLGEAAHVQQGANRSVDLA